MALDASTQAIVVVGATGSLILSNPAAQRLGISLEHLGDELAPYRESMRERGEGTVEVSRVDTLGRTRRFALDCVMRDEMEVVTIRDVTDLRCLDAEVRQLRRLDAVGHVAASVLHDFNNLMTPIVCSSALLERAVAEQEHAAELAREIREASERAAELLRRVLSFARRPAPGGPARVSVSSTISELRSLLERVGGTGVKVAFELGDEADEALIDREELDHALLNLVANARDAMPNGGTLSVRTANVVIGDDDAVDAEDSSMRAYVAVTISDTGVGMSAEVRERIFERFFTTKSEGRGTGLGLSNARRFANESGGFLTVHSEPNVGTTVVLYLPLASPRFSTPISKAGIEVLGGSESVLVVDDDPLVRSAVVAVLESRGYRALDAASGEEALAYLESRGKPVDLMIVDIVLSGMNGRELARRAQSIHPVKVLFTSGHTPGVLERHGFNEEDTELLRKAFTPRALCAKVRQVLDAEKAVAECG